MQVTLLGAPGSRTAVRSKTRGPLGIKWREWPTCVSQSTPRVVPFLILHAVLLSQVLLAFGFRFSIYFYLFLVS